MPFSKREWIQVTVLLAIIQAFFWYVVFENSQSASALGYVSFAGTLVSIILAVLAIGYTYGESISQKNKSDGLAEQIKTLGKLIDNVEIEAKSLEKIQDISKELSSFIGAYRNDKQSSDIDLRLIQQNIEILTQSRTFDFSMKADDSSFVGPETKIEQFMKNRTPLDEACYLMLVYIEQNGVGLHNMKSVLTDILNDAPLGLDSAFFYGAIYTQASLLEGFGYMSSSDGRNQIFIDEELTRFIINSMLTDTPNQVRGSAYNDMIKCLHDLVKSGSH
ncbi:hypothetical protein [Aeromonas veronii]|uniref:hypothetical protein n=1 Tax=Aeromonas veronii TaxID=654 RepID=UPI0005C167AE|nr:hypothetical protein [Aeromonas veronii]